MLYGCDPGWSVVVRNDSNNTVLLRITDGSSTIGYLPAGSEGTLFGGLGAADRNLQVLAPDCTVSSNVETGDQGTFSVVIAADGSTTVTTRDHDAPDVESMRELGRICGAYSACPWNSPAWPSEVPRPSNLDWDDFGC